MDRLTKKDVNKLISLVGSMIYSLEMTISMRWGVPARDLVTLEYYKELLAKLEAIQDG